jgi:thiol-disulfide isomerase/thioredoxin
LFQHVVEQAGVAMTRRSAAILVAASPGQVKAVAPNVVVLPEAERAALPAFAGQTVDGRGLDLAAVRRPLVLNFWASWCGPCRAEQEGLELAGERLAARGVRLVGVNVRDDRGAATSYLEEFDVGYPSLFDRPAVLAARLGRLAPDFPPYTLVVDADGRVAARVFGVLPGGRPEAQAAFLGNLVEQVTGT